jgi:hypothetical protein
MNTGGCALYAWLGCGHSGKGIQESRGCYCYGVGSGKSGPPWSRHSALQSDQFDNRHQRKSVPWNHRTRVNPEIRLLCTQCGMILLSNPGYCLPKRAGFKEHLLKMHTERPPHPRAAIWAASYSSQMSRYGLISKG